MKNITKLFILSGLVLLTMCRNVQQPEPDKSATEDPSLEIFDFPIKKFSLLYDSSLQWNGESFVFLKENPFDTTYLIQVKAERTGIFGICYLVLPSQHRDLEDYTDEKRELMFFEGISFRLTPAEWDNWRIRTSQAVSEMSTIPYQSSICIHCAAYNLRFEGQNLSSANAALRPKLERYSKLTDSLLHSLLSSRNNNFNKKTSR